MRTAWWYHLYCHTVTSGATWLLYSGPNLRAYIGWNMSCAVLVVLCNEELWFINIMYTYSRAVSISVYPLDSKVLRISWHWATENKMLDHSLDHRPFLRGQKGLGSRLAGPLVSQARSNHPNADHFVVSDTESNPHWGWLSPACKTIGRCAEKLSAGGSPCHHCLDYIIFTS